MTVRDEDPLPPPAEGAGETLTISQQEGGVTLTCEDDLWLQAPVQSTITIENVAGNAAISLILSGLTIDAIEGNAVVNSVNAVAARRIEGNFTARLIAGDLRIESIEGNATIAKVGGDIRLGRVEGNLVLEATGGSIEARRRATSRCRRRWRPVSSADPRRGGITCEVPRDAGGVFRSRRRAHPRARPGGGAQRAQRRAQLRARAGAARLTLEAEGNIMLRGAQPHDFDPAEFSGTLEEEMALRQSRSPQQITRQIETQVNELSRQLDDKLSRMGTSEELATSIQDKVQSAMRRAEEKLAEALRKVEQRTQEAESRRPQVAGVGRRPRRRSASRAQSAGPAQAKRTRPLTRSGC
jgi:ElaB/YqjD/DUF883 family membrane-anchored ribosome-binding protein